MPFSPRSGDYPFGDIAQLVERLNGIEKVRGSTPLISTSKNRAKARLFCYIRIDMAYFRYFLAVVGNQRGRAWNNAGLPTKLPTELRLCFPLH